ncbi:MAG: hypothetical protein ACYC6W_09655 [Nitrosotalea sp.]
MGKKDDDNFWGALGALLLGAVGLAILSEATKPNCPICRHKIERGTVVCPHCGSGLSW